MTAATVLATDPIGGDVSVIAAALAAHGLAMLTPTGGQTWHDLAERADAVIVNLVTLDAAALSRLPRCRVIARLGVGYNNVDIAAARARGIVVTNVPDYCREEVSDHALALMLALVRKLPLANADVHRGVWKQLGYRPIRRLNTLTLGLVGFGRLARALARKALALGLRVIAHDPYAAADAASEVQLLPLDALLAEADVISVHAPHVPGAPALIGRAELQRMKAGAILINTSRGELIDEAALVAALEAQHLAGAALDVLAVEPLAADSPLRGRPDVLLTPHMAFYSEESLVDLQRSAADEVARVLAGQAPHHRVA